MKPTATRYLRLAAAASLLALAGAAAADESEIFTGTGNAVSNARPNILFIMDTSGSMTTNVVTQVPYDPATTYAGSCNPNRVYFIASSNTSSPPPCADTASVPVAAFHCNAANTAFQTTGYYLANTAAQWRTVNGVTRWRSITITG